ncbi:MAG TPA: hypothetical protein VHD83_26070 [Puia sp.]|nr:hypothetical protein [Puia sp.]
MRNLKLLLLTTLTLGFFMTMSCKKGDTGPAGPAGPDSVMYSNWATLSFTGSYDQTYQDSVWLASVTAPQITAKVLNTGSVVGYFLLPDPATGDSSIVNAINYVTEYFTPGYIDILATGDFSGIQYRYVIIPGKITITDDKGNPQTYTSDQIKKMDYTTLTGLLNIPAKGSGSKQISL